MSKGGLKGAAASRLKKKKKKKFSKRVKERETDSGAALEAGDDETNANSEKAEKRSPHRQNSNQKIFIFVF